MVVVVVVVVGVRAREQEMRRSAGRIMFRGRQRRWWVEDGWGGCVGRLEEVRRSCGPSRELNGSFLKEVVRDGFCAGVLRTAWVALAVDRTLSQIGTVLYPLRPRRPTWTW